MPDLDRQTIILRADPDHPEGAAVDRAAAILRAGGLVAFPTETVYGLGADALNPQAVEKIFAAKGRPADNPLIVHVAGVAACRQVAADWPAVAQRLAERFWPGPLTLVLPARELVPAQVTAGLPTVAVRVPAHAVALSMLKAAGIPVAAPSANLSGGPSPTTAQHVQLDLSGRVDAILDGGPCPVGVESTVLDLSGSLPTLLRPGGIPRSALEQVVGEVALDPGLESSQVAPRSPGMKYRHYSPRAEVYLVPGEGAALAAGMGQLAGRFREKELRVGLLISRETAACWEPGKAPAAYHVLGSRLEPEELARGLYAALRESDRLGVDVLLAETYPEAGLGEAVMNRLRKAASQRVLIPGES